MTKALELARRVATSSASAALIVGESGAGKEVIASYIHRSSPRSNGPFVRLNVAAIPETMMEAELFGATRGAFTDARRDRQGFFSAADGGILLLDEIGELKPELQAKLLRAIETRRFYPVGATRESSSDVFIVAATNRDPAEAVASGRLRADLYYRLATMVIRVPSLRERADDIPLLARSILARIRRSTGRGPERFDDDALAALVAYPWPGNVRELRNAVERVAILTDRPVATLEDLESCGVLGSYAASFAQPFAQPVAPPAFESPSVPRMPAAAPAAKAPEDGEAREGSLEAVAKAAYEEAERRHILSTLEKTGGNRTKTAELLKISRSTLWLKLRRYGIDDGTN
jgi:DNA-binding NtrC family response regulator